MFYVWRFLILALISSIAMNTYLSAKPTTTRNDSLGFIKTRVINTLSHERIDRHLKHLEQKRFGRNYQKRYQSLNQLNFASWLNTYNANTKVQLREIVRRIDKRSATLWFKELAKAESLALDPNLRSALSQCQIELRLSAPAQSSFEQQKNTYLQGISKKILKHQSRSRARVLPKRLPLLPHSQDPLLKRILIQVKRAKRGKRPTASKQLARLERMAALYSGSPRALNKAISIRNYLNRYKESWASNWIESLYHRYPNNERLSWSLEANKEFVNGISTEEQTTMNHRINEAWSIVRGLVDPKLLNRLPQTRVVVDKLAQGASHGGVNIILTANSSVKDILHEIGHHIEDFGGIKPFSTAHVLLTHRSFGNALKPLREIDPNGRYLERAMGYKGGFIKPYMGKRYPDGSTELLSTSLESFATKKDALEFFRKDGDHFLRLVQILQRR